MELHDNHLGEDGSCSQKGLSSEKMITTLAMKNRKCFQCCFRQIPASFIPHMQICKVVLIRAPITETEWLFPVNRDLGIEIETIVETNKKYTPFRKALILR